MLSLLKQISVCTFDERSERESSAFESLPESKPSAKQARERRRRVLASIYLTNNEVYNAINP